MEQDGSIRVRIQWELNYLLFQATFNQCDEVVRSHNIQMRLVAIRKYLFGYIVPENKRLHLFVLPFNCRNEISSLAEKVRSLEVAMVYQRKQQAIAVAALAAEKLKKRGPFNEFHSSDSNLAYNSTRAENQSGGTNTAGITKRIQAPIGKRLLLKVCFLLKENGKFIDFPPLSPFFRRFILPRM